MARNHLPKTWQLFNLTYTCLNNMFYNRDIDSKTRDGLFTHL